MPSKIEDTTWVWVIIQDPESQARFFAQQDTEAKVLFVPTFISKEDAQQGLIQLPCERGHKYEPQAILYEDLCTHARESRFLIYLLDADGRILQILPEETNG